MDNIKNKIQEKLINIVSEKYDKTYKIQKEVFKKRKELHFSQKFVDKNKFVNNKFRILTQEIANKSRERFMIYTFTTMIFVWLSLLFGFFSSSSELKLVFLAFIFVLLAILVEIYNCYFKLKIATDLTEDYWAIKYAMESNKKDKDKIINKINDLFKNKKHGVDLSYKMSDCDHLKRSFNLNDLVIEENLLKELSEKMTEREFKVFMVKNNFKIDYLTLIEKVKDLDILHSISKEDEEKLSNIYNKMPL